MESIAKKFRRLRELATQWYNSDPCFFEETLRVGDSAGSVQTRTDATVIDVLTDMLDYLDGIEVSLSGPSRCRVQVLKHGVQPF